MTNRRAILVAGALAVSLAASLAWRNAPHGESTRPIPAPSFRDVRSASRAELVAYARTLTFDASYHASDSRRLTVRRDGQLVEGPLMTLAPEIGAVATAMADFKKGRILGRITSEVAFAEGGYGAGENYLWVEETAQGMTLTVIPEDPTVPISSRAMEILHKGNVAKTHATARFRWDEGSRRHLIWLDCEQGCCTSGGTK